MGTIYGDKNRFAVEWELDSRTEPIWFYGRVCFWIAGQMIGDYASIATLGDVLSELKYPVGDCGDRNSSRFCSMASEEAFNLIHAAFYSRDCNFDSEIEEERWARFDVSMRVDVFGGWKLYLFDCQSTSRLLAGQYLDSSDCRLVVEQVLEVGEFDRVIRMFQRDLLRLVESAAD